MIEKIEISHRVKEGKKADVKKKIKVSNSLENKCKQGGVKNGNVLLLKLVLKQK